MAVVDDPRRQAVRAAATVIGLAVVWLTVIAFTQANPVDLTVALLVVLAEVLIVAVLSGPWLAVLVALAAVVLVNWYLVPPYGTFEVASTDNVVALLVFVFVAAVAAALVEIGARARARAEQSGRQADLLGTVVSSDGDDGPNALERVRTGLGLEQVELRGESDAGLDQVLASAGPDTAADVTLDVSLPDGYHLVGRGPELFAPDPDFLASLGAAAVRSFESGRMVEESMRADELAAIDRARTALLASVGHDLRTPLSTLRVSIEALQSSDGHLTDVDRDALLHAIAASTDRLDDLITNLLDMSRLQAGVVLAHPEATDLLDVVAQSLVPFPAARLVVEVPEDLPTVSADPALLERVIANLVSNALRYSPVEQPVTLRATHDDQSVVLHVLDHGPGLAASDTAAVFTPFHRVGAQPDGGSGLGLAIVRGFAEAMDATVELRPGSEGGLDARLVLPRWSPAGAAP
jgi:K+-sensing histidine kinase KdpD